MEQPANFKQDLIFGQESEKKFFNLYKTKWNLVQTDGKSGDFLSNGKKLELKADKYKLSKTGNLFIETIRNTNTKAPGGVFQAVKEHQVEIFIYWFPGENIYFKFNAQKLVDILPRLLPQGKVWHVENDGYYTEGYIMKAELLLPYCEETNYKVTVKSTEKDFKKRMFSLFQGTLKRA